MPFTTGDYQFKDMVAKAKPLQNTFYWANDYDKQNGKNNEPGKEFFSAPDIPTFIEHYYNRLDSSERHCYEIVHSTFYMYFDLDVKLVDLQETLKQNGSDLNISDLSDNDLYYWFDSIYREFITYFISDCPNDIEQAMYAGVSIPRDEQPITRSLLNFLLPNWVVTTASDHAKLSLHLVNRNVIFQDLSFFKQFYTSFKAFFDSFIPETHPFKDSFDTTVSSKHRMMRLCGSTKLGSKRVLRPLEAAHPMGVKLQHTFISDAINDPKTESKLFSQRIADVVFKPSSKAEKTAIQNKSGNSAKMSVHFECPDGTNPTHITQIKELLAMLSDKRTDSYKWWLEIGIILKRHKLPYEVFEDFSKRSKKFDKDQCRHSWDNFPADDIQKPLTLGTLHYYAKEDDPTRYQDFKAIHQVLALDFPFTADRTICNQFIPEDLYLSCFAKFDCLALKSAMMTGKTAALPGIFKLPEYKSIVVVYFRVSLSKELIKKWKNLGFEIYTNIKDYNIDLAKHQRVIIQIDSLPRLHGKTDLLVLDEIESTYTHLCGFKQINHQDCYRALKTYIHHTPKILLADANLSDETVNILLKRRLDRTVKVLNTYQSFSHFHSYFMDSEEELTQVILDHLKQGKKVVVPTNQKAYAKKLTDLIQRNHPLLKVLSINANENDNIEVDNWDQYDVLIYTPTIVAGVSFDKHHFDVCCAYFINHSCNVEMSSQMLHRVRHLTDNKLFICTPTASQTPGLPITNTEIMEDVTQQILQGHFHLQDEGLQLNHIESRVVKNSYFQLYCAYKRKRNLSTLYFESYLKYIFKFHGIHIHRYKPKEEKTEREEQLERVKQELKLSKSIVTHKGANDIISAKPISSQEYINFLQSRKERSKAEQLSVDRHYFTSTMDLPSRDPLTGKEKWVIETYPYLGAIQNSKEWIGKELAKSIELVTTRHKEQYNYQLYETAITYSSQGGSDDSEHSSDDDGSKTNSADQIRRKIFQKKNTKQTIAHSIHYNTKWLKIKVALELLQAMGFTHLDPGVTKIKPNWTSVHQYCRTHEKRIRALFGVEKKQWKEQLDGNEKKSLNKYINHKLEKALAINLEATSHKCLYYKIEYCYKPSKIQSQESENDIEDEIINLVQEDDVTEYQALQQTHKRLLPKKSYSM